MKLLMRFAALFCILLTLGCDRPVKGHNGVVYRSAKEYNNYIIDRQKQISRVITSFYDHVFSNQDSAGNFLAEGLTRAQTTLEEVSGMPAYKGDSSFRNAAIRSFAFYKGLFEHEYPQIIALRRGKDSLTDDDKIALEKISGRIINEEEQYDKDLHNTQKEFAEKNNMRLVGSDKEK